MKKIILSFFSCLVISVSCFSQECYTIVGVLEGITSNKIHLVTEENSRNDTLASVSVVNGAFKISGKVDSVKAAYIIIENYNGRIPIMLENVAFQVKLSPASMWIEGGEAQCLYNQYNSIGLVFAQEQIRIQNEYKQAEREGNQARMKVLQTQLDMAFENSVTKHWELIKANANHYVTAYVIALGMRGDNEEQLQVKYALLGEQAKATVYGKIIADRLEQYGKLAIGEIAPDFKMEKSDGTEFTLHGVSGKLKLLNFWASWSVPCRQENPNVVKIFQQFRPKDFKIISISLDEDKNVWKQAIGMDGMLWVNGSDFKGWTSEIVDLYLIQDIPYTLLLDAENRIVAKNLRGNELHKKIAELLKKK